MAPTFVENNGSHQILINTVEKQNITLSCDAEGNPTPTIYWYRDCKWRLITIEMFELLMAKLIHLINYSDTLISTGPHLALKDINRHSHTEYECVARNNIEPDPSRHFKINVNCMPTFINRLN